MPDISVALGLLKKPIEDAYSKASSVIQQKIANLKTSAKVKQLHKKLWQIQRVKTIWNTDRPLSLSSIYYPVWVQIGQNGDDVRQVNSVDDLQYQHVIVYGTAGQGKSILMKYLVGREIRSGKRIPVLCELRNAGNRPLEEFLVEQFSLLLGLSEDSDIFCVFASNGNICFLLDGFDELDDDYVQSVLQQIDVLSIKYSKSKIVITSRPNADCRNLTSFHSVSIKPLGRQDLPLFLRKITKDTEFTERLVSALGKSKMQIRSLVTTPLLATLLAISYRSVNKIPDEFADFYEELFQILLVRHDASKLGWRRTRKSGLNDRQIQSIFEAFCFAVKRKRLSQLDISTAQTLIQESAKNSDIKVDENFFLEDVKKITCLVTQEGKRIEFIHASVPQFFAAMFVRNRTEEQAKKFYAQLGLNHWKYWLGESFFLEQIDNHRFAKYFAIPDLEKFINEIDLLDVGSIAKFLNGFAIRSVRPSANEGGAVRYYTHNDDAFSAFCSQSLEKRMFNTLFSADFEGCGSWFSSFNRNPTSSKRTYMEIATDRGEQVVKALTDMILEHRKACVDRLTKLRVQIEDAEKDSDFISL